MVNSLPTYPKSNLKIEDLKLVYTYEGKEYSKSFRELVRFANCHIAGFTSKDGLPLPSNAIEQLEYKDNELSGR